MGMFIPLYGLPVALLSGMTPPLFWFFQGWVQGIAPASSSAMMRLVTVSYMPKDICSSSLPKAGKASVGEGDGYLKYITVRTAPLSFENLMEVGGLLRRTIELKQVKSFVRRPRAHD